MKFLIFSIAMVLHIQFVESYQYSNGKFLFSYSSTNNINSRSVKSSSKLYSQALVPQHLDLTQQIFCNVELNGENLEAVGFDMDFTLAQVIIR